MDGTESREFCGEFPIHSVEQFLQHWKGMNLLIISSSSFRASQQELHSFFSKFLFSVSVPRCFEPAGSLQPSRVRWPWINTLRWRVQSPNEDGHFWIDGVFYMVVVWFICYLCGTIDWRHMLGAFFRLTKIVQPRRRRSAPKKRPDSQSLSSIGVDENESHGKKTCFLFLKSVHIVFFSLEVTTKALGTYIRDLRDLRLIHRKPLPLPRVEVLHPENLPGSLHHSCICCTSAFLCHFCPFCTCQAAGRTQGYSVREGVKPHSWEEEIVLKSFWMKKPRNSWQF